MQILPLDKRTNVQKKKNKKKKDRPIPESAVYFHERSSFSFCTILH